MKGEGPPEVPLLSEREGDAGGGAPCLPPAWLVRPRMTSEAARPGPNDAPA